VETKTMTTITANTVTATAAAGIMIVLCTLVYKLTVILCCCL